MILWGDTLMPEVRRQIRLLQLEIPVDLKIFSP